jgi:dipeptidyl aminopeptidase/acylaminoacyl peptidase
VLPGARQILFTIWKGSSDASEVALLTLPEGEIRSLVTGTFGRYVDSGHLVFFDGSFMMVAPLDLEEGRITANPVRVPGIESGGFWGYRSLALSRDGLLALAIRPTSRLLWVDREGRETPIRLPPASYRSPALSPRGDRLAVSMSQGGRSSDIWLFDADGGGPRQLTERGENLYPMWINEDWIAFHSERDGVRTTYRKRADSSGDTEVLIPGEHGYPLDATPDGRWVSINYLGDIWLLSLEGGELRSLVETPFNEANAFFSPDGRWYSYTSVEFEETRGHVALLDGSSGRLTLDGGNVFHILWSPGGDEIFTLSMGDPRMMSVRSFAGGRLGPHRDLFPWPYVSEGVRRDFDTDGERFLVIREDDSPTIRYVENWFEEVRGLLPE